MKIIYRHYPVTFLFALLLISRLSLSAQVPESAVLSPEGLETFILPTQDNRLLLEQELQRRQAGLAPRFAVGLPVHITTAEHGRWDVLGDLAIWRFRLRSAGAHSLNLGFTQYHMPEGGQLLLYDPDRRDVQGPFTPADNEAHNELWTPVFPGDELIIEVSVPRAGKVELLLELGVVNHDFLGFGQLNSGSCNLDVVCGLADGWPGVEPFRDVARSVGMYSLRGLNLCTGFLVNNTRQDCTPYFLTAKHCEVTPGNAASVVVYWNFENSTCRQPNTTASGQNGDGKLDKFNTGSIFRASWANSDFCLLELDDAVSPAADAYFAGWSAEDVLPEGVVASIHHPLSDEKRISLSDKPRYYGFYPSPQQEESGDQIIVSSWTTGTTQSGSSGAPLFNQYGQAIGQLTGGDAACGNEEFDSFGRMYNSWEGGGTTNARLRDWLDPLGLGVRSFHGRPQDRCGFYVYGKLLSGRLCAGATDTLELELGPAFGALPTFSIGPTQPDLQLELELITGTLSASVALALSTTNETPTGNHIVPILITDGNVTDTTLVALQVVAEAPVSPQPLQPSDLTQDQFPDPFFRWTAIAQADRYRIQLAADEAFEQLVTDRLISGATSFLLDGLDTNTTYYWRVAAENACGVSDWSPVFTFTTSGVSCGLSAFTEERIDIPASRTSTISSQLEVTDVAGKVAFVEVADVRIEHSWVGDLSMVLRSPGGVEVALMDRPGFPQSEFGCDGRDLQLSFNQEHGLSYQDLEKTCGSTAPSISGTYRALESLGQLAGQPAAGTWTLIVKDQAADDGGVLLGWGLNICTAPEAPVLLRGIAEQYAICMDDSLQLALFLDESADLASAALSLDPADPEIFASFTLNPLSSGDTTILTLGGFPAAGNYELALTMTEDGVVRARFSFRVDVLAEPEPVLLQNPAPGSVVDAAAAAFSWNAGTLAERYRLEIAAMADFAEILQAVELTEPSHTMDLEEKIGTYYWRVIAINDCGESSSTVSDFTLRTTGVYELEAGLGAKVFPNPFSDRLTLAFGQPLEQDAALRVRDVTGRSVAAQLISRGTQRIELPLDRLAAGLYVLELHYREKRYAQRIIKVL